MKVLKPILALSLCLLAGCTLPNKNKPEVELTDEQALLQYRLSMDSIEKMGSVIDDISVHHGQALIKEFASQSTLMHQSGTPDLKVETNLMETKMPEFSAVLKKHGLSPREYLLMMTTMLRAGAVVAAKKQGIKRPAPFVAPENVNFVIMHEGQLRAFVTKWSTELRP